MHLAYAAKSCQHHDYLFFAMVLAQIQPLEDVAVPWLQVHSKGPLTLPTPLVHIPANKRSTYHIFAVFITPRLLGCSQR